uniref:Uncharacterized protein n=1 Tax=Strongyloides stercoralis TaxID=6248 RepID=A0AAF5DGF1_STRER
LYKIERRIIIFCIVLLFNYCRGVNLKCNSKYPKKNVKYCYFFVAINEGTYHNLVNCLPVKLKNQLYKIRYGKLPTVFKLTRMNLLILEGINAFTINFILTMKCFNLITIAFYIILLFNDCHFYQMKCYYFKSKLKNCLFRIGINEPLFHKFINYLPVSRKLRIYNIYYGKMPIYIKLLKINKFVYKHVSQQQIRIFIFKNGDEYTNYRYPTYLLFMKNNV